MEYGSVDQLPFHLEEGSIEEFPTIDETDLLNQWDPFFIEGEFDPTKEGLD